MTDKLATYPAILEIATPELLPLEIPFTKRLRAGESVTGVGIVKITNPITDVLIPLALSGPATNDATSVFQTVDPQYLPQLPTDVYYEFVVTAQIGNRRESTLTKLKVLF